MDTKSEDASSGIGPSERAGGPASAPVSAAVARQCERAVVRARKAARDRMEEMIMTSKIEECLALIEPDTDLSDLSKTGTTMMHAAVRIGRCEVIKALLDAGADVDMRDEDGKTPLFASLDADLFSGSTTELLLESGADIESTDQLGRTALSYSVCQKWSKQKYWHRNSVYDLLAAKASMNTQDNQGYTPLMHAVIFSDENNCHAARDKLLEHDPDVAIKTHAGTGLLDILATQDCPDWGCVVLCLISGSVVEPCELSSRNSLLDAVKNRDVAYAKFLIWTSMSLPEYKNISGDLAQLRCKDVREALFLAVSLEIVPLIRTFAIYHYSWPEDDNGWAMSLEDWCCPESEEDRMHPLVLNDETIMHAIIRTGSENLWNAIFLCDHGDEIMQEESFQKLIQYRSHVGDITPRQLAEKLGLRRWRDACESSRMRSQVESEVNRRRPSGP
jgi:ankyrin repeat protein